MASHMIDTVAKTNIKSGLGSFKSFYKELKSFDGFGKVSVTNLKKLLANVDSGVKSVDDLVRGLPVKKSKYGYIDIGGESVGYVNRVLRAADLDALIKLSGKKISINSADKQLFRNTVGDTAEKAVADVVESTASLKTLHPYMDTTAANINKLSVPAKRDLAKVESNLMKYAKRGAIVTLTFGTVVVGVDWVSKATLARSGCFMLTTIDGKTTSCKVKDYSCLNNTDVNTCTTHIPYYNITLVIMQLAVLDNTDKRKIDLAAKVGVKVEDFQKQLGTLFDTKYEIMSKFVLDLKDKPPVKTCTIVHPDIEKGVVPPCRMCSPTSNPLSTEYIDSSQYGENITFQCVSNPSILETIADATISTGKNLWEGVTGTISGTLKPIWISAVVILVLVLIVTLVLRFMPKSSKDYLPSDSVIKYQSYI